ncbi:MAG: UDP-glucose/GDP-mannose dehydrogenase family protein [Caldilineaceae bacterium]|nr:UDP-glucose/GDP-mannose dehydrogenase family protein [Caldilineaceae bacterium]
MSHILIVGSGVVGQATGKGFAKQGHQLTYVDVDPSKIAQLRAQGLRAMTIAQVDWENQDIVMLTVSTPTVQGHLVLDHLKAATAKVGQGLATTDRYITVVVRSTVPPTTTEKVLLPILEQASGKVAGKDFGVAFNPEFLRQRTSEQDFDRPWITVLGATDAASADVLNKLYMPFGGLIVNCQPTEAEMIKYVNNVYNAVKISYFNEVHQICEQLGIDSRLVGAVVARSAESMWNPLYGTRGGVPYGGACLPKDTLAFMEFCRNQGLTHDMLAATIQVNEKLEQQIPAVASPEEIEQIIKLHRPVVEKVPTVMPPAAKLVPTNGHAAHHFSEALAATAAD